METHIWRGERGGDREGDSYLVRGKIEKERKRGREIQSWRVESGREEKLHRARKVARYREWQRRYGE